MISKKLRQEFQYYMESYDEDDELRVTASEARGTMMILKHLINHGLPEPDFITPGYKGEGIALFEWKNPFIIATIDQNNDIVEIETSKGSKYHRCYPNSVEFVNLLRVEFGLATL